MRTPLPEHQVARTRLTEAARVVDGAANLRELTKNIRQLSFSLGDSLIGVKGTPLWETTLKAAELTEEQALGIIAYRQDQKIENVVLL